MPASASPEGMSQARATAIGLLARREHSRQELGRKILLRHVLTQGSLEQLLDQLEQAGYLSDERYARMVLRSAQAKGQGADEITHALREKGVSSECIRVLMDACGTDWLALARQQRERRFGTDTPRDFKERARQSRFLAGRGFYVDTINAVFHEEC